MTRDELLAVLRADYHRYGWPRTPAAIARALTLHPGFRYTVALRACQFCASQRPARWATAGHVALRMLIRRWRLRYGIDIPPTTQVGPGLYLNHPGGIVVNSGAVIGANCNMSQGVTVGQSNRGSRAGLPVIGDGVYIGPGAVITGAVHVGDDVAIGANCVVTSDVPDHSVVVGVPGRVVSQDGAAGYVNRTDW
jgi:serine O-acetyltransferase